MLCVYVLREWRDTKWPTFVYIFYFILFSTKQSERA